MVGVSIDKGGGGDGSGIDGSRGGDLLVSCRACFSFITIPDRAAWRQCVFALVLRV